MEINAAKNALFKKTATFYTKENRRIYSISDLQLNILYVQVNVMIYLCWRIYLYASQIKI